jgi:hypothetical protein
MKILSFVNSILVYLHKSPAEAFRAGDIRPLDKPCARMCVYEHVCVCVHRLLSQHAQLLCTFCVCESEYVLESDRVCVWCVCE